MLRLLIMAFALSCAFPAAAEEYWIAYEGNDFPENEGWTRLWSGPPAERWIENGSLVIDSRASTATTEWYEWYPQPLDPSLGEVFIMEWRLRVDEMVNSWPDISVGVFSDERWAAAFHLYEDTIESVFEEDVSADFQSGVFHEFELRTSDMRTYELYLDGALAIEGSFWLSLTSSKVGWGDTVSGAASLARWDHFRFGVVPEPSSAVGILLLVSAALSARSSRHEVRKSV